MTTPSGSSRARRNRRQISRRVRDRSPVLRHPGTKGENKLGILPGFQYTEIIEDNPEHLSVFRNLGVRIMQITYNNRNSFGDGCLEAGNAGLSKAGIAAVKKMNEAGVAVDLSHSGYRTTSEAIAASPKPVLISHAGCAAVYAHPRNKPDEILKSLADRGGYFGVPDALPGCVAHHPHSPARARSFGSRHQCMRRRSRGHRLGRLD